MKKLQLLCAAAVMGMLLCGCTKEDKTADKKPVSIDIWTYYNGNQLTAFDEQVEEFNQTVGKDKGIVVNSYSQGSVNDLHNKVLASVRGDVGADEVPEIFAAYTDTAYTVEQISPLADLKKYMSEEEREAYIESYIEEGDFSGNGEMKIFPTAKSTEVLAINKTDWDAFADANGVDYSSLATIESLVETARLYYDWTDAQTPDTPNDGKALFGRDAMANYMLIGGMQLGDEIFAVREGKMTLDFDKAAVRKLWDCYYVPLVKGYFASTGRFRSDDIKTGNIICYVGSSSSLIFFPEVVNINDTESYPIEMDVIPAPRFQDGQAYAVQQGAGMVVTKGSEEKIRASVEFLKWFTQAQRNIEFAVQSGYMPVLKKANDMAVIKDSAANIDARMEKTLSAAVNTVNEVKTYTPRAFEKGSEARDILEYSLSDKAAADREIVKERLAAGQTLEEATAEFCSDACFDAWYAETLKQLQACAD